MADMWRANIMAPGASPTDLCKFALTVPQVKTTRNVDLNNTRVRLRSAVSRLVDLVMKNPAAAEIILSNIQGGVISVAGPGDDVTMSSQPDSSVPSTFKKMDIDTKSYYLTNLPEGPSEDLLKKINFEDTLAISDCFYLIFSVLPADHVPVQEFADRTVAKLTMTKRAEQVGNRQQFLFGTAVSDEGTIDWGAVSCYETTWGEDRKLVSVRHRWTGDIGFPKKTWNIDVTWPLLNPQDEFSAHFSIDDQELFVKHMFQSGCGPFKHALDARGKLLKDLAVECKKSYEAKKKEVSDMRGSSTMLRIHDDRVKRVREECLEKARNEQAAKRKAKQQRQQSFDGMALAIADRREDGE